MPKHNAKIKKYEKNMQNIIACGFVAVPMVRAYYM